MVIQFDRQKMLIIVRCSAKEEFKPTENVILAQDKADKLRKEMEEFSNNVMAPAMKEIEELIIEENKKYSET
jgi:hypothetical protein